ncbi:hypothetical protein EJB05_45031 [Eragrostis curvula]|uniref:Uncharacterized protein n=1 Tax=Eragrostis curvula TaxID=38414 RepID=A0A5J9TJH5_9POAL|nr:hypothetical protein EJB05_45031 [Eragrostis curvula]
MPDKNHRNPIARHLSLILFSHRRHISFDSSLFLLSPLLRFELLCNTAPCPSPSSLRICGELLLGSASRRAEPRRGGGRIRDAAAVRVRCTAAVRVRGAAACGSEARRPCGSDARWRSTRRGGRAAPMRGGGLRGARRACSRCGGVLIRGSRPNGFKLKALRRQLRHGYGIEIRKVSAVGSSHVSGFS